MRRTDPRRRQVLQLGGLVLGAGLAGCSSSEETDESRETQPQPPEPAETTTEAETPAEGGPLTETAKLVAADGDAGDAFGTAVAVTGESVLVGAPGDEDPNGGESGSAYLYTEWTQTAKLVAADGDADDHFGAAVALSGTQALVGAPADEDPHYPGAGSAYVFDGSGGEWTQTAKLAASGGDSQAFGERVALSGGTALLTSQDESTDSVAGAGVTYVFEQAEGGWRQAARLVADDADSSDRLGSAVALSPAGDTALVGTIYDKNTAGEQTGAAYVFERGSGSWSQAAKLQPESLGRDADFGEAVAISGSTALVGAGGYTNPDGSAGAAFVFDRAGGDWTQSALLHPAASETDAFGTAVALSGDGTTALVGDPDSATVFPFSYTGDSWEQDRRLAASDGAPLEDFGEPVALSGDGTTGLVGDHQDDEQAGSAYVFEL